MSQNEKVEKLLNGIAVSDFDSAIMDVCHRTEYANDFHAAKDYLTNWYRLRKESQKTSTRGSNVSSVHTAPAPEARRRARSRKRVSDPDSKPPAKDLVKIAETATKLCEATPARYGFDPVEIAKLIRSRSIKYTVYSSEEYASFPPKHKQVLHWMRMADPEKQERKRRKDEAASRRSSVSAITSAPAEIKPKWGRAPAAVSLAPAGRQQGSLEPVPENSARAPVERP